MTPTNPILTVEEFRRLRGLEHAGSLEEFDRELTVRYRCQWPGDHRYTMNHLGFRGSEHSTQVDTGYFGCSMTFGIGALDNEVWTQVLDVHERTTSNNYGVPSIGCKEIEQIFLGATRWHRMRRACILLPDIARIGVPMASTTGLAYWHLIPNNLRENRPEVVKATARSWFTMPETLYWELARSAVLRIEQRAQELGIRTIWSTWSKTTLDLLESLELNLVEPCWNDLGGFDGNHPSAEANFAYAMRFRKGF